MLPRQAQSGPIHLRYSDKASMRIAIEASNINSGLDADRKLRILTAGRPFDGLRE